MCDFFFNFARANTPENNCVNEYIFQNTISIDCRLQRYAHTDRVWDGADYLCKKCEPFYKPEPKWVPVDGDTKGTLQRDFF